MAIVIALIPAFAWGSIGLVSGKLGGNAYQQTLGMTIGALIFGVGTWLVTRPVLDAKVWALGILSGLFWVVGQSQQFQAMKYIGVSMALPMSTGMQLIANTLAGALLFHEWETTQKVLMGVSALALLILGSTLSARKEQTGGGRAQEFGAGLRALLISTAGLAVYTVVVRAGNLDATAVVLPQSVGMVIGGLLFALRHEPISRATAKNLLTGVLWGTGNVFMLLAMNEIGLAIAFSLSQSGAIISTFGSILYLGEKKTRKEMQWVTMGTISIIAGVVILAMMK